MQLRLNSTLASLRANRLRKSNIVRADFAGIQIQGEDINRSEPAGVGLLPDSCGYLKTR
jgi:hypothetical protein